MNINDLLNPSLSGFLSGSPSLCELVDVLKSSQNSPPHLLELANRIRAFRTLRTQNTVLQDEFESWCEQMTKFIKHQFAKAEFDSLRELVANGGDAQLKRLSLMPQMDRTQFPIDIQIDPSGRITVSDQGNGLALVSEPKIGNSSLAHLIVPGLSSKGEQPESIGHFGQGFYPLLNYLSDNWARSQKPAFCLNEHEMSLSIIGEGANGKKVAYIFKHKGEQLTSSQQMIANVSLENRITILSYDGYHSPIKIEMFNEKDQLSIDICDADKKTVGTTITIESAHLAHLSQQIEHFIKKTFQFYLHFPIYLNHQHINSLAGYTHLPFDGGVVYYNLANTTRQGQVMIYEKGVFVLERLTEKCTVPATIAISFNDLAISSDRASIDFQHEKVQQAFLDLIKAIIDEKNLSPQEQALLLNALHPIVKQEQLNACFELIKQHARLCLGFPDKKMMREFKIIDGIYFHPDYIETIQAKCLYSQLEFSLYSVPTDTTVTTPYLIFEFGSTYVILINQHLVPLDDRLIVQFNLAWIKKYFYILKQKELPLNVSQVIHALFLKQEITLDSSLNKLEIEDKGDHENKDDIPYLNEDEILGRLYDILSTLEDDKLNDYRVLDIMQMCFAYEEEDFMAREDLIQATLVFLTERIEKLEEIFSNQVDLQSLFAWFIYEILSLDNLSAINLNKIFTAFWDGFIQLDKINQEYYLHFLLRTCCNEGYFVDHIQKDNLDFAPIQHHFLEINKLLNNIQIKVDQDLISTIFKTPLPPHHIKLCRDILDRMLKAERQIKVLLMFKAFEEPSFLMEEPIDLINKLIDILPYKQIAFNPQILTRTSCKLLITYIADSSLAVPNTVKQQCANLYYFLLKLEHDYEISFNLTEFFKIIHLNYLKLFDAKKFEQDIKEITSTFERISVFRQNFIIIKMCIENYLKDNSTLNALPEDQKLSALISYAQENLDNAFKRAKILQDEKKREFIQNILTLISQPKGEAILELYNHLWRKNGLIAPAADPVISAACLPSNMLFKKPEVSGPFTLGKIAKPLHCEKFVLEWCGQEVAAVNSIKTALNQKNSQDFSFLIELVNNSMEAGATEIDMRLYVEGETIIFSFRDNGEGMNKASFDSFLTPGKSTKIKLQEQTKGEGDINFGRGAFSAFGHADQTLICSYREKHLLQKGCLSKTEEDLLTLEHQEIEPPSDFFPGTHLMLRKKVTDPITYYIHLKAAIFYLISNVKGVKILFDQQEINNQPSLPAIEVEETYYIGHRPFKLIVKLGTNHSGIYINNMRRHSLPSKYLDHLPPAFKNLIEQNNQLFAIFLPTFEQEMNRKHLINEDSILIPIKRAVFIAATQYMLSAFLESHPAWHNLSDDVLFDFQLLRQPLNAQQESIKKFFETKDWNILINPQEVNRKKAILDNLKNVLFNFDSSYQFSSTTSNQQVLDCVEQSENHLQFENQLQMLRTSGLTENGMVLMMHLPLFEGGASIYQIRELVIEQLLDEDILKRDGTYSYNKEYLKKTDETVIDSTLSTCFNTVAQTLGDDSYAFILQKFKVRIAGHIRNIYNQAEKTADYDPNFEKFAIHFFTDIAKLLKEEIQVGFYEEADASDAYNIGNTNVVKFNRLSSDYRSFLKFYRDYLQSDNKEQTILAHLSMFINILHTLSHEISHIKEGSEHMKATHTPEFKRILSSIMLQLTITKDNGSYHFVRIIQACLDSKKRTIDFLLN